MPQERTFVLDVGVSPVSLASAVSEVRSWLQDPTKPRYVTVTGVHGVMEAQRDSRLLQILNESSLTVPDGMPLVWASWWAGQKQVTRVYGPDLMLALCSEFARDHVSCFYYGGNEGVAEDLAQRMQSRFPGLKTAGTYCPPFRTLYASEELEILRAIRDSGAQVVWVGLSTPKQERWMSRFIELAKEQGLPRFPILLGVGAAFDFHTGRVRQAPRWIQKSGLEWLFRLCMEPKRLWKRYLSNNPRFIWSLLTRSSAISFRSAQK